MELICAKDGDYEAIRNQEFYFLKNEFEIYAGMIVNHKYNKGYHDVQWTVAALDDELLVIHALGVLPKYSGRGIAKIMVKCVIQMAEHQMIRTIRLDVLEGNIPVEHAYVNMGFQYVTTMKMFYEDTGWTNYKVYEYVV